MKKRHRKRVIRRPNNNRLYSAKYKEWIRKVFARDGFKCIMCKSAKRIQAHHIIRYADSVAGRQMVSNGCTLCKVCHDKVTGKEQYYAPKLRKLVREKAASKRKE